MTLNNGWLEFFLDDKYDKDEVDKFCSYNSFIKLNSDTKYFEEFVMPKTEIENKCKNYKAKKIILETNSQDLNIKFDDNYFLEYKDKLKFNQNLKKNSYKIKIVIEPVFINEEKFKIPLATFTTI